MTRQLTENENAQVLILTNKGGEYGLGHYNRMSHLRDHLEKLKIKSDLVLLDDWDSEKGRLEQKGLENYKVVALDSRDDQFPEMLSGQKRKYTYFIAVDNRGGGRGQSDIVWDTLPHPEMEKDEMKRILKNCILSPDIFEKRASPEKAVISRVKKDEVENESLECDLYYKPRQTTLLPSPQFHELLINAKSVATYFGQTFFEALYLGKSIYLYDVSDYHAQLSDVFLKEWKEYPDIIRSFDGQGLHRLAVLIKSILSGVLDFPMM